MSNKTQKEKSLTLKEIKEKLSSGTLSLKQEQEVKTAFTKVNAIFKQGFATMSAELIRITKPIIKIHLRVRELRDIYDKNLDKSLPDITEKIQSNLDLKGHLSATELLFLMMEMNGIDTSRLAKQLGSKGGENKRDYKSEIYNAVLEASDHVGTPAYEKVRRFFNNENNHDLIKSIEIIRCELPESIHGQGVLEYQTAAGKSKEIGCSGIQKHLGKIRALNKLSK